MAIVPIREGVEVSTWVVGDSVFIAMHKGKKRLSIRVSVTEAKRIAKAITDAAKHP